MSYQVNHYLSRVFNFILPPRCVHCGKSGSIFCEECQQTIKWVEEPVCNYCGEPILKGALCRRCQQTPLKLQYLRAAVLFKGSIPKVIHQFKYNNAFGLAEPLGRLMVSCWDKWGVETDCIVPIPLHEKRLKERGYNQAMLLARPLARYLTIPINNNLLFRIRQTQIQARLNADERRTNVQGAFQVNGDLQGKHILLVDDVCTTGATLDAAAAELLNAGAASVSAYCLARASSHRSFI